MPVAIESFRNASVTRAGNWPERRREPRYPCNDPAEVQVASATGPRLPATMLDISRSGLRVVLAAPVWKGADVEVILPKQAIIFGRVCHCRQSGEKFYAGIRIQDVFFRPHPVKGAHIEDQQLARYLAGLGLSVLEVLNVRAHLLKCKLCRSRFHDFGAD